MATPVYRLESFHLNAVPRRRFAWGIIKYSIIFGLAGAYAVTDGAFRQDDLKMRPDMQVTRILSDIPLREKKVHEFFSGKYYDRDFSDKPQTLWKKAMKYCYPYHYYKPTKTDYLPYFDFKKDYITTAYENHYHFKQ